MRICSNSTLLHTAKVWYKQEIYLDWSVAQDGLNIPRNGMVSDGTVGGRRASNRKLPVRALSHNPVLSCSSINQPCCVGHEVLKGKKGGKVFEHLLRPMPAC